jgi:L-ascorbate metabolism protein UlaG (beta-lactamase superfamily)
MMATDLIPAFTKGILLQAEILHAKQNGGTDSFDVWWLGQSGFLIQWNKVCLLFDPYLSDSLTRKYATTNKPHVRMSERVIEPQLLDCIDIVTSSHNHTDHLDADTLIPLLQANPGISFVIPEANRGFVTDRVKCEPGFPIGLTDGQQQELKGFTFHGIPSAHNTIDRDENGKCKFMGFVVTFGKFCVYHSGDTLWFDGLEALLKQFPLDVAFLPINGNDPSRGVAGNLDATEAVLLGKEIQARFVIPHHYHMFAFNTSDPKVFEDEAKRNDQPHRILGHGEKWSYERT